KDQAFAILSFPNNRGIIADNRAITGKRKHAHRFASAIVFNSQCQRAARAARESSQHDRAHSSKELVTDELWQRPRLPLLASGKEGRPTIGRMSGKCIVLTEGIC